MGYTPYMATHTEHTVPQTSVRQSRIHFTQVGQALPAHPLFLSAIDYRFATFARLVKMLWATTSFGIHKTTVYLCTCVPVYLCTCVPVYLCTCVPVYLCTCVPVYLCTCVPVYLCTCVPVYKKSQKKTTRPKKMGELLGEFGRVAELF